ncbi:MAG: peptidylprolyl isomerase [Ignavibacteriales bacterium]|nr:peptidylprolyl isomerase [Ignavibacteriales bacterium]
MRSAKLILLLLPLIILISCTSQNSNIVVAEFGGNKIYLDEFEKAYAKNSGGFEKAKNDSLSSLKQFLDLYVNYKMKLRDASVRGLKSDEDMKKEYLDYKMNIGKTLFLENKLYDPNLHQLYERRKTEYRVSHIFLLPDSTHSQQQIIDLGNQLIKRIQNGEDFAELAKQYSNDPYTSKQGGDVYFVTAGQINIPAIEDAIYSTEPGNIYPQLVSSGFGYHILKVTVRQPRKPSIEAAHILIPFADSTGVVDTVKALNKISDIEKQIKDGKNFGEMAAKYSADKGSAAKNGELGSFQRGQMVREFDEAAFNLKVGEVSSIVKTKFGFHLIRVNAISPLKSYDEEKNELKDMYDRTRYKFDLEKLMQDLKTEFSFVQNQVTYNKILANSDTLKIGPSYWTSNLRKQAGSDELFKINNKPYSCDSLFNNMIKVGSNLNMTVNGKILQDAIDQYAGVVLFREKALVYDKENPEFAKLLEDYENGMYLFKILEDEVWSKISIDSVKTYEFWQQTKENYRWKDRVELKEIYNQSDSLMNNCYSMAISGYSYDSLVAKYNRRSGYENKIGYNGLTAVDFNELAKQANSLKNIDDISKPFKFEDGWSIVKLLKREPARAKTFEEARAEASSLLQEKESKRLEDEYMNKLKNIYHPKMYYEELQQAFKQPQ